MSYNNLASLRESNGMMIEERAITQTLYVDKDGDNSDGESLSSAFNELQDALDIASTATTDVTLIMISPGEYDIDREDEPMWSGNYILQGSHRSWATITNTHFDATAVMGFSGMVGLSDLEIKLPEEGDGLYITGDYFRIERCFINGEDITGAQSGIKIDAQVKSKFGKIRDCDVKGNNATYMIGIDMYNCGCAEIADTRIGLCLNAISIDGDTNPQSEFNSLHDLELCSNYIGINILKGDYQRISDVKLQKQNINIYDLVGTHIYNNLIAESDTIRTPDDFVGIEIQGDGKDYDANELLYTATTRPFRITGVIVEPQEEKKYVMRMTADDGTTYFDHFMFEVKRNKSNTTSTATEHIFNAGTEIKASVKCESNNKDIDVWLSIQEI